MAKQIKVIKCPQCGSTKPEQIRPDYYRCDKCGTQFFLDNDDVNVNVNHNISSREGSHVQPAKVLGVGAIVVIVLAVLFLVRFCSKMVRYAGKNITTYRTYETPQTERDKYLLSMLLPARKEGVVFYLEDRAAKDSTCAVFRNVVTGEIINEQNIGPKVGRNRNIAHRRFRSDSTDYIIIDQSRIYKVDIEKLVLIDVTGAICSRKPALEAGLMQVDFIGEGVGEGFRVHTNLGKELFYFPVADVLYTEKAFKFTATDNTQGLLPGARNQVYYLFLNKESSHSSNVAQLMEITYLFNNGGPENKLQVITGGAIRNPEQYRIVSSKAITGEQVCFSPAILYSDDRNILISFRPTLATDAVVNVQLFDTSGTIVWTVSFTSDFRCMSAVRTGQGFMLQTSGNNFWEISYDGKSVENYHFKK
ncbi:MAG: hypothetical protein LBV74_18100 [Tannerella sp.]|jgi:DNA-directed RNA polymerase subunit RPC12/RpoP|nr:hypothetical protein [Tannerella sp.]